MRIPKYRLHKTTGQALVEIAGRRFYLGKHNSEDSKQRYRELLTLHLSGSALEPEPVNGTEVTTVGDLILRYFRYAQNHYVRDGKPTAEVGSSKTALRRLRRLFSSLPAAEFGPKKLKTVRESMIGEGLSRKYINDSISRIKRMFRWAVSEELVNVTIYQALLTVTGLRHGQSAAKPSRKVTAVPGGHIEKVLAEVSNVVAAMINTELLTGVRPNELCRMKIGELQTDEEIWVYIPAHHKTEHFGVQRKIAIGPKAQAILAPLMEGKARDHFVFNPAEAVASLNKKRRENRETPLYPSHANRPTAKQPRWKPGECYKECSYATAIRRACKRAGVPHWSPNQLRHTCGTNVRAAYGAEAAAAVLGNSLGMVVEIYAERNFELAKTVMKEMG